MSTPKYIYNQEDEEYEISDQCLECKFLYVEDIWNEFMCPHSICPFDNEGE